jgi:hypothetical protein
MLVAPLRSDSEYAAEEVPESMMAPDPVLAVHALQLVRPGARDPLGPSRGVLAGIALGGAGWCLVAGFVWFALRIV